MKIIIALGGLVMLGLAVLYFVPSTQNFVNERIVEVEKVNTIDVLDQRITAAKKAATASTTMKAQEAYNKVFDAEMKRVTDTIKADYIAEIEETISDPAYWREGHKLRRLIQKAFPEDPQVAVAVATCESGLKTDAYNPKNKDGTTDGGIFQINSSHNKRMEKLGLNVWNPKDNIKFARILYDERGWQPWVCYTHGMIAMR